jgi:hypothetical protein
MTTNKHPIPDQPKWNNKIYNRPDIRKIDDSLKLEKPIMIDSVESIPEAIAVLANVLNISEESPSSTITTPVENVTIKYKLLRHLVERRGQDRERYANYILPTLKEPFEIWRVEYEGQEYRNRYIGVFKGSHDLMVSILIQEDGSLLWNIIHEEHTGMNRQRLGELIYTKKQAGMVMSE